MLHVTHARNLLSEQNSKNEFSQCLLHISSASVVFPSPETSLFLIILLLCFLCVGALHPAENPLSVCVLVLSLERGDVIHTLQKSLPRGTQGKIIQKKTFLSLIYPITTAHATTPLMFFCYEWVSLVARYHLIL